MDLEILSHNASRDMSETATMTLLSNLGDYIYGNDR